MPGLADTGNSFITFTSLTSNPLINAGLPSNFSFTAGDPSEQFIRAKANATAFFSTNQWTSTFGGYGPSDGADGWTYGAGRVVSLSTFSDNSALSNSTYDRMLTNSFAWAAPAPVPEPTPLMVYVAGILGLLVVSGATRRGGVQPVRDGWRGSRKGRGLEPPKRAERLET
jgi:hypothetical protein